MSRAATGIAFSSALLLLAGCQHRSSAPPPPPPPPIQQPGPQPQGIPKPPQPSNGTQSGTPGMASLPTADSPEDAAFVASHTPVYTLSGTASWYGPPYNKRRGANGEIFDQDALTAANRTLPLNSLIMVTNLKTGRSAIMRVTDRGPFVHDRILDLSVGSAKVTGVYLPGLAPVRIDVYYAPSPIDQGGRWCVQIGAFKHGDEAEKLRDHLQRKYQTANVIEFTGPTGHWVRIRPLGDDKGRAVEIANELQPSEGEAYLTRLD
jgi:rare lipoprotein A